MLAYGAQVREEPLLSEALAVARETMRRVRHNIDVLLPRLRMIGYQFGYGWVQPYMDLPAFYQTGKRLEELEAERFTYEARLAYTEFLEQASKEPIVFASAKHNEEHICFLDGLINESQNEYRLKELRKEREYYQSLPSAVDQIQQLEAIMGPLPLSVRAWYEEIGESILWERTPTGINWWCRNSSPISMPMDLRISLIKKDNLGESPTSILCMCWILSACILSQRK